MLASRAALLLATLFSLSSLAPSVSAFALPSEVSTDPVVLPPGSSSALPATTRSVEPTKLVAPFGVVPEEPTMPISMGGSGVHLPSGPYEVLLSRLALADNASPNELAAYVADYFHQLGFSTPGAAAEFEENASISYTFNLGDVDSDGRDDFALDSYCNDPEACRGRSYPSILNPKAYLTPDYCAWPHKVMAHSGTSGRELWNRSFDGPHPTSQALGLGALLGCKLEYIVGTVPDNATRLNHLLVYRWEVTTIVGNPLFFQHEIYVLNATDGEKLWTTGLGFDGEWLEISIPFVGCPCHILASNFLLNPLLMVRKDQGIDLVPQGTRPGLLVQGVGFNLSFQTSVAALPYSTGPFLAVLNYQPDEWAMALDPLTGVKVWERETFQPDEKTAPLTPVKGGPVTVPQQQIPKGHPGPQVPWDNRSVFPLALQVPPLVHTRCLYDSTISCLEIQWNTDEAPGRYQDFYWAYDACCFDVTGDQVPDLLYTVYEWSNTPMTNNEGPFTVAGRLVGISGSDGAPLFDIYPEPSRAFGYPYPPNGGAYQMRLEHLGDVNADGSSEFFLHEWYFDWDFRHNLTVIDGKGEKLWKHEITREIQVQPLGDANGDGGVDFALFDYTMDVRGRGTAYSLANVTWTPVSVIRGDTGERLHQVRTFMAPSDIRFMIDLYRVNGIPDFNGDGVGDIWLDEPLFLPDLTTVHRFTTVSGANGDEIFRLVSAGVFAFPTNVGDTTGDGTDDFYLLSGDPIDLWGTAFHGNNGTAMWSRRVLATRTSSYATAQPLMRSQMLHDTNAPTQDFVLNFHFRVRSETAFLGYIWRTDTTRPQLTIYGGTNGTVYWALPSLWDVNSTVLVHGPTPASQMYANAMHFDPAEDKAVDPEAVGMPTQIVVGAASFGAAFGAAFLLTGRRWRF